MSAVRELTDTLIAGGMHPGDAAMLVARAGVEMAPPADTRTAGAKRQAAWRERNKTSPNVTEVTASQASQTVTNHNETSQSDIASLSLTKPIDLEKKKKRESAKAAQLPEGWRPDEPAWQAAVERIGAPRCELELQKFRNHAADKGRTSKSWSAAWRNWVDRSIEYGARNGQNHGKTSINASGGSLIAALDRALERSVAEDADLAAPAHPLLSFSR